MKQDCIISIMLDGKTVDTATRKTERGVSAYINRKYSAFCRKYGIDRTDAAFEAEYGYFDEALVWHTCGKYHA